MMPETGRGASELGASGNFARIFAGQIPRHPSVSRDLQVIRCRAASANTHLQNPRQRAKPRCFAPSGARIFLVLSLAASTDLPEEGAHGVSGAEIPLRSST
jgi:hypothetical protein